MTADCKSSLARRCPPPSPDVAVFFDITEPKRHRGQVDVATEERTEPHHRGRVAELPRDNDINKKVRRIPQSTRCRSTSSSIPRTKTRRQKLLAYPAYGQAAYLPLGTDDEGRIYIQPINIYLKVRDGELVIIDGDTEEEMGDYDEVLEQREGGARTCRLGEESPRLMRPKSGFGQLEAELSPTRQNTALR